MRTHDGRPFGAHPERCGDAVGVRRRSVEQQTAGPSGAPAAGAAMSDVITWIEAGHPADPSRYHTATRDGVATPLGDDIAVSALAGKVSCMTDAKHTGGAVVCLVSLTHPAPPPATAYGQWQGGWVDFDGTSLQVGSARADPGPFVNGNGTELANGDSLAFGSTGAAPTRPACTA
ncbi:putative lppI [Mycobacterium avium subsp. avium 2285 (R)]|nr:putative lppI [Mycobacterium avium subsp. avium 2285 (R)]